MAGFADFPIELQLEIFDHYFRSSGGSFLPLDAECKCVACSGKYPGRYFPTSFKRSLGPTALLLVSKRATAIATESSLQTRTTAFHFSQPLSIFSKCHAYHDTARHLRNITLDLRIFRTSLLFHATFLRQACALLSIRRMQLLLTDDGQFGRKGTFAIINHRKLILAEFERMRPYLPVRLTEYAVSWPSLERPMRGIVNSLIGENHTPEELERLPKKEKPELIGRYNNTVASEHYLKRNYLEREEYKRWSALWSVNDELADVLGRGLVVRADATSTTSAGSAPW